MMAPPLSSLVKYDNPVLVSTSKDKGKGKGTLGKKVRAHTLKSQGRQVPQVCQAQLTSCAALLPALPPAGCPATCGAEARLDTDRGYLELHPSAKVATQPNTSAKPLRVRAAVLQMSASCMLAGNGQKMGSYGCSTCQARQQRAWT